MYFQEAAEAIAAGDSGLQLAALDQPPGPINSTPRPPQIMKKHVPCTDTSHKNVDEFLEHLKTLSWYSGQVGQKRSLLSGAEITGAQAPGCAVRTVAVSLPTSKTQCMPPRKSGKY